MALNIKPFEALDHPCSFIGSHNFATSALARGESSSVSSESMGTEANLGGSHEDQLNLVKSPTNFENREKENDELIESTIKSLDII